jgi:zinc protease
LRSDNIIKKYFFLTSVIFLILPKLLIADSVDINCFQEKWPYELSDISPDPELVRGRLENGLRYIIMENHEPEKRVALYLDVQAGSFNEAENQRGIAHFLEHMMFNGTQHFPPGSLVDYFQKIGMNYGGDANAHTSHRETVYNLVLPDGSSPDLEKGLLVLADYAGGALLFEKEIDRERNVILAEKRSRDSAMYRTHIATLSFAFRGTRIPERTIIGREEILEKADRKLLKSYYDSWYRPENMVLVVVGDIEIEKTRKIIDKLFSGLHAAGKKPPCPPFGRLQHKGEEFFYHYEPELSETDVSIEVLWDKRPQNDSFAMEIRELKRYIGSMIMRYRLQKLLEKQGVPFTGSGFYYGDLEGRIGYGSISAKTDKYHWRESLGLINDTLRQALLFGFFQHELERAQKEILAGFDAAVLQEKNEDSRYIARKIIRHINNNRVLQSAKQERSLYAPIVQGFSLDDINTEFKKIWDHDSRLISVTGDAQPENGIESIKTVYLNSKKRTVKAVKGENKGKFPYLEPPENKTPFKRIFNSPELGIETIRFDNGLVLNMKKTDFKKNEIELVVSFGSGELAEPVPGMSMLAEDAVNESGTGKFSKSELNEFLAGTTVNTGFSIAESSFFWRGSSLKKDFDILLEVIYSHIFDITVRKSVFESVMTELEQMYQKLEQDIDGAVPLKILPFLAGGNAHFGLPPRKSVLAIDYSQLLSWVRKIVPENNLEISVVGDFERDHLIKSVQKYFSGVHLIPGKRLKTEQVNFPVGKKIEVKVKTSIEKSVVIVAWLTDDFWDISRTRRFHLLASIFEDRLRKLLREKMGITYSPEVFSSNSRTYKKYGFIAALVTVEPGKEKNTLEQIYKLVDQLREQGITAEELERAKKPLITAIRENLEKNSYWLYSVLWRSFIHPQQLTWPLTIERGYSETNRKELDMLSEKYLTNDRSARAVVRPD